MTSRAPRPLRKSASEARPVEAITWKPSFASSATATVPTPPAAPVTSASGPPAPAGATLVRIAGLMRSGTNLLTWVLRNNFTGLRTATMLLGWKHGPIHRDRRALTLDDYVDPRHRDDIHRFVRDQPERWARLTASDFFRDDPKNTR